MQESIFLCDGHFPYGCKEKLPLSKMEKIRKKYYCHHCANMKRKERKIECAAKDCKVKKYNDCMATIYGRHYCDKCAKSFDIDVKFHHKNNIIFTQYLSNFLHGGYNKYIFVNVERISNRGFIKEYTRQYEWKKKKELFTKLFGKPDKEGFIYLEVDDRVIILDFNINEPKNKYVNLYVCGIHKHEVKEDITKIIYSQYGKLKIKK